MDKRALLLLGCVALAGCMPHFKSRDSYGMMFRHGGPSGAGDPYTFGGVGEGSGGTMPRSTSATDSAAADFRDATETGRLGEIDRRRDHFPDPGVPAPAAPPSAAGEAPGEIRL